MKEHGLCNIKNWPIQVLHALGERAVTSCGATRRELFIVLGDTQSNGAVSLHWLLRSLSYSNTDRLHYCPACVDADFTNHYVELIGWNQNECSMVLQSYGLIWWVGVRGPSVCFAHGSWYILDVKTGGSYFYSAYLIRQRKLCLVNMIKKNLLGKVSGPLLSI
jgi:hypothetical protein